MKFQTLSLISSLACLFSVARAPAAPALPVMQQAPATGELMSNGDLLELARSIRRA